MVVPPAPTDVETLAAQDDDKVIGSEDARVSLLRLAVPDLVVAQGRDHEHQEVGFAYHDGAWTAVLLVEPTPALITQAGGAPSLPLSALAPCLEDRGVVLDSIQMTWHCYPGSAALPTDSPARTAVPCSVVSPLVTITTLRPACREPVTAVALFSLLRPELPSPLILALIERVASMPSVACPPAEV